MNEDQLEKFIDDIYVAAFDNGEWIKLLEALRVQFHGSLATAMVRDVFDGRPLLVEGGHADPADSRKYREHYYKHDLWSIEKRKRWIAPNPSVRSKQPLVITDEALTSRTEFLESEAYQDYMRHHDIGRGLFILPFFSNNLYARVHIHRSAHLPEFSKEEIRQMTALAPHIRRALGLRLQRMLTPTHESLVASAFDSLADAAFLLDHTGRVLELNHKAKTLIDAGPQLMLYDGRLVATHPSDNAILAGLLQKPKPGIAPAEAILRGPSSAAGLRLTVTPLNCRRLLLSSELGSKEELVFLVNATELGPKAQNLIERYALTPAEAEVSLLLAQGLRAQDIAVKRTTKIRTINTQIEQIYRKTGVNSHAALLVKLLGR